VVVDSLAQFDQDPPGTPVIEVLEIVRGKGPVLKEDGLYWTKSTDDIGSVKIRIVVAEKDVQSGEELGYRLLFIPDLPELSNDMATDYDVKLGKGKESYTTTIHWLDGSTDDQEPLSGVIEVYLIDKAGNVSEKPGVAELFHPGS
jgi:hypothetical protein